MNLQSIQQILMRIAGYSVINILYLIIVYTNYYSIHINQSSKIVNQVNVPAFILMKLMAKLL